ncbi:MAG: TrmJ/YjtD family RNA methyltransferase [Promethearchaeota archaeon]|nr:MAG: TrmJ/YjtD family RNA methyltransferase [Candidatus Lokiarchaeota archaeon]
MNKKKLKQEIESFRETEVLDEYKNIEFSIVLVQPEHAGNIGAIARIMKNFNFNNLIIFNPIGEKQKIFSHETHGYAMHGSDILEHAEIIIVKQDEHLQCFKDYMKKFDLIFATTAKGKHYRNIKRLAIFPDDVNLPASKSLLRVAILFGKESRGLTNEELDVADILIRIPTADIYSTLNISHACGIILYEIFKKIHSIKLGRGINPVLLADKNDRRMLYELISEIINILKIRTHRKERVLLSFKNIFERSLISRKELSLMFGVLSKINSILKNLKLYE